MSISPSDNQGSTSSSSSSCASSHSSHRNHGYLLSSSYQPELHLADSLSLAPLSASASGQVGGAQPSSDVSSKEVNERERRNHGKSPLHHIGDETMQPAAAAQAAVESSEWQAKQSGANISPISHQSGSSTGSHRMTGHPSGKRTQMISGNHLLNFQYDPIPVSRSQYRAPPPRRQQKRKPYNKDLFFQANYKFVVLDSGNYAPESMDPDKMFSWDDIICLKYYTPFPVQCPICLDDPLCPQITSCGHIFCFPCILQYFSVGEDDIKGESWKKCPLCFTMISSKDLCTIQIANVKQYHVGDPIEFVLLTRRKDSFQSSVKNNEMVNIEGEILDSFSKFTLTSDVELSVREAMSDLDSWIAKADSGLVDDIEKLPYVCAAMEQLERRKKFWNEHRICNGNKANISSYGSPPTMNSTDANFNACDLVWGTSSMDKNDRSNWCERSTKDKEVGEISSFQVAEFEESLEDNDRSSSSSYDDSKNAPVHAGSVKDNSYGGSYNFYQAVDGQHIILHPLNMKCLLHHYGSYERLPNRITGKILQLDTVVQSEAMRRRYRFLSHFSLTTTIQLCEIDLSDILPVEALSPYMDEIKNREKQRTRIARKEHKDKIRAEIVETQFVPARYESGDGSPSFSMDDFEVLGSTDAASLSSPTVGERQSFSSVARLGFAAGHDSPSLKTNEIQTLQMKDLKPESSSTTGSRNAGSLSFADITSRANSIENAQLPRINEVGKKGKKPSRVLLSTAGGRRY